MGIQMKRTRTEDGYDSFEDDEADKIFVTSQALEASQRLQKTASSSMALPGPPLPKRQFQISTRPEMRPLNLQSQQQKTSNNPKNSLRNFKIPTLGQSISNVPEKTIENLEKQIEEMKMEVLQKKGAMKHLTIKLSKTEQESHMLKVQLAEKDRTNQSLVEQFKKMRNRLDFNNETMPFQNENYAMRVNSVPSKNQQRISLNTIGQPGGARIFIHDDSVMDVDIAYVTKQSNVLTTMAPITAQPLPKKSLSNMEVQTIESKTRKTPESYRKFKAEFDILWKKRADFIKPNTELKNAYFEINSLFRLADFKDQK